MSSFLGFALRQKTSGTKCQAVTTAASLAHAQRRPLYGLRNRKKLTNADTFLLSYCFSFALQRFLITFLNAPWSWERNMTVIIFLPMLTAGLPVLQAGLSSGQRAQDLPQPHPFWTGLTKPTLSLTCPFVTCSGHREATEDARNRTPGATRSNVPLQREPTCCGECSGHRTRSSHANPFQKGRFSTNARCWPVKRILSPPQPPAKAGIWDSSRFVP